MELSDFKRIVIKIGSSLLVDENRSLNTDWLGSLIDELISLKEEGHEVLIVSSGAIALGGNYFGIPKSKMKLEEKQAAAASGQIILAHAYQELFNKRSYKAAQILLTLDDLNNARRYQNASNTIETLIQLDVIPIINENDTVAIEEIQYGDNDQLAARVCELVSADCLILFSDIDGLYDDDPKKNPNAELIKKVEEITPEIEMLSNKSKTEYGSGGIETKIKAAKICLNADCNTIIANGNSDKPISNIRNSDHFTIFSVSKDE
ncbi:MAG: glutamate 5-kinase [Gammaproteobacteria bacterium]|jgi:glutamate 5-kinase|nr:glutamate 5-kinase [Gammaproteobacteria bacterium]MBQ08331.1 glutamate 5-kinase [Gammaproteobacteria bacterium]MDP6146199.1 glutamate 5-kinase [Gammaproteobacteria bacterium]HJL79627.1 glutamate 5-kinase [Gammaproteobacteria bacterium]HJM08851.1 glutamate 5-kinase [Gammaproteobacteria bacterium]|tara:strand:+ start:9942 stop:10730 length:789 start_codon:yes stop_codon:yes gene_type:complete